MKKSDLRTGMWIEKRDGNKAIILLNTKNGNIYSGENTWGEISNYNEDLKNSFSATHDILKVYQPTSNYAYWNFDKDKLKLIWERETFKPYLKFLNENYGFMGNGTYVLDIIGRNLKIGDTVELYDGIYSRGERSLVHTGGVCFIMGLAGSIFINGVCKDWKIIKKRSYEEIADGEVIDSFVKYIKSEPTNN